MGHADMSVRAAFWIVAVTAVAHLGWAFFAQNESWLAPVVRDVRVTSVERDADAITLAGDFQLLRSCTFLDLSMHAGDARVPSADRERLLFRTVPGEGTVGGPRPDGTVSWGPWRIERPHTLAGPHLFMRLSYRCNGMAASTGVFIIGDADLLFDR
jgi:hypothetical protein